jgi:putative glutamine amidotransferase
VEKPRIGIPCFKSFSSEVKAPTAALRLSYVQSICRAEGLPLLIPPGIPNTDSAAVLDTIDGLLLIGGSDISPECYGELAIPACEIVDPERDSRELSLTHAAAARNLPILGICRGVQLLNVAFGGTLFQDIETQYPHTNISNKLTHNPSDFPDCLARIAHSIDIVAESKLADILGVTTIQTNSIHHQAIKDIAPSLRVSARAADGIIEGVEHTTLNFCIGVQSHPEELSQIEPQWMRLFERFVDSCRRTPPVAT